MNKDYFSFLDNHVTQSNEGYFDLFKFESDNNPFILNNSFNTIDSLFIYDKEDIIKNPEAYQVAFYRSYDKFGKNVKGFIIKP